MKKLKQKTLFTKEDLSLFYEVSTSIHSIHDLDDMLRCILHNIKTVFHIAGASIGYIKHEILPCLLTFLNF